MHDMTELVQWLLDPNRGGDAAQLESWLGRNKPFCDVMSGLFEKRRQERRPTLKIPGPDAVSATQVTIMDNWPRGKPEPYITHRYGVSVDIWTCKPDQVSFAKGAANLHFVGDLRTGTQVEERRVAMSKKKIFRPSDSYFNSIATIAADHADKYFVMLEGKGRALGGTVYPDQHFLILDFDSDACGASGGLIVDAAVHALAPFVTSMATKKGLAPRPLWDGPPRSKTLANGKVRSLGIPILQSRTAVDPKFDSWVSHDAKFSDCA